MIKEAHGKLNLLELCASPSKGGLELYFANISNELEPYFNLLNVVSPDSQVASLLGTNRPVLTLDKKAHYLPLMAAVSLARIIDEHNIDVVHIHWNKDLTVAVFAKLFSKSKPKIVLTRHMKFPSRKNSFFHRFLYRNIDHIIAITQTMAADLERFIAADIRPEISVNYLGVHPIQSDTDKDVKDVRLQYDPDQKLFLIALVGRIDSDKGHDILIDAMLMAKDKGLPFKTLIVGHAMHDDYLESIQRRVQELGLEEYVVFTGFVDKPRRLMQACDTLILTTIEETFGLVLIEAMSVGVTVIGSNRGGVPEIIEDHKTGLLFKSTDSEDLFRALNQLYEKPEEAQQYANKALETVRVKFSAAEHLIRLVERLNKLGRGGL